MRTQSLSNWRSIIALSVLAALPFCASAGKPTSSSVPLKTSIYTSFVDEQDTNAYFNTPNTCNYHPLTSSYLRPDTSDGPTTAWDIFMTTWQPVTGLTSGVYDNSVNGVRSEFGANDKVYSLDTRTTSPLRKITLDFSAPYPPPNTPSFGSTVTTPGLLQVSGLDPITSMAVCSSDACREARQIATKFWFTDPSAADVTWRVDWAAIRVLRVTPKLWYFIADACGGSQVAGLSKLTGNRTRPREILNGYFLVPLFFAAELK